MKLIQLFILAGIVISLMPLEAMEYKRPIQPLAGVGDDASFEAIAAWIQANPDKIDEPDVPGGRTALYYAASKGREPIVEFLLANEADPNIRFEHDGTTPFLIAVKKGKIDIVKLLVEDADVKARSTKGENVLHMAVHAAPAGGDRLIEFLYAEKPDEIEEIVNDKDQEGVTPLQLALQKGAIKAIQALLQIPGIDEGADKAKIDRLLH